MQLTNEQELAKVVKEAVAARGLEVTKEAITQYALAFKGTPAAEIKAAFFALFAADQTKSLPAPRVVLDEVVRQRGARRYVPQDPPLDDADRRFAAMYGPFYLQYTRGELSRAQVHRSIKAAAANAGHDALRRGKVEGQIREHLGDWEHDHGFYGKPFSPKTDTASQLPHVEQGVG